MIFDLRSTSSLTRQVCRGKLFAKAVSGNMHVITLYGLARRNDTQSYQVERVAQPEPHLTETGRRTRTETTQPRSATLSQRRTISMSVFRRIATEIGQVRRESTLQMTCASS